ncbi:TetR family transcriptional regulator [Streptomonospora salina]|uniref:AcrR family transcriptional regulator n=1 Tax=Streptomonospora salina TaxID=104205 RepID=A0A841EHJ3_9ACTN|nr:TetR family transcriptional regulator [Streptomonospora salina]MBB6000503.1 AcrR family transcriptional regulator [Streptomonospora salina]
MTADLSRIDTQTFDRILCAAARVFARHGLRGLEMASIAAAVADETGVAPAALRRDFPTRLDLACAIALNSGRRLVDDQLADRRPGEPAERIERLVRRHIDHFRHRRAEEDLRRTVLPTLRAVDPARYRELSELRTTYLHHLRSIVADGATQGRFPVDSPDASASAVLETLESVVNWYEPGDGLSAQELGDVYTDLIVHHHLGGPRG